MGKYIYMEHKWNFTYTWKLCWNYMKNVFKYKHIYIYTLKEGGRVDFHSSIGLWRGETGSLVAQTLDSISTGWLQGLKWCQPIHQPNLTWWFYCLFSHHPDDFWAPPWTNGSCPWFSSHEFYPPATTCHILPISCTSTCHWSYHFWYPIYSICYQPISHDLPSNSRWHPSELGPGCGSLMTGDPHWLKALSMSPSCLKQGTTAENLDAYNT